MISAISCMARPLRLSSPRSRVSSCAMAGPDPTMATRAQTQKANAAAPPGMGSRACHRRVRPARRCARRGDRPGRRPSSTSSPVAIIAFRRRRVETIVIDPAVQRQNPVGLHRQHGRPASGAHARRRRGSRSAALAERRTGARRMCRNHRSSCNSPVGVARDRTELRLRRVRAGREGPDDLRHPCGRFGQVDVATLVQRSGSKPAPRHMRVPAPP